jgi:hypothetical protein
MMALFMVVEHYTNGPAPVYERAAARGRMLPAGLRYVDSWVVAGALDTCFQLMETDDPALFDDWTENWLDLVAFDIYPVVGSAEAAAASGLARLACFDQRGDLRVAVVDRRAAGGRAETRLRVAQVGILAKQELDDGAPAMQRGLAQGVLE